jgi:hypothetical protein
VSGPVTVAEYGLEEGKASGSAIRHGIASAADCMADIVREVWQERPYFVGVITGTFHVGSGGTVVEFDYWQSESYGDYDNRARDKFIEAAKGKKWFPGVTSDCAVTATFRIAENPDLSAPDER